MDNKSRLIGRMQEFLITHLSQEDAIMVTDELTRVLSDYEVIKAENSLVVYDNINEELLKRFCACLLIEGKSKKTVDQYRRTAIKFAQVAQKPYTDVNAYDIRCFLAMEKGRGISDRTLENTRANLSSFFQWLTAEELIQKNPCVAVKNIKFTKSIKIPFSPIEIDALRFACKTDRERAMLELLLSSGIRVSELTALTIQDIDFEKMSVHVRCGKGGKARITYINDLAKMHLLNYLMSRKVTGDYLFYNKWRKPLNAGGVRHILNQLGERAKVPNVHPHRFRRTFASTLAQRGMAIEEIRKLLGHSNLNTTLEYVYTSDEQVQVSYRKHIA